MKFTIEEQVKIIEAQLDAFDTVVDKLLYMNEFFANDPAFSKEARNIVVGNICKSLPK